jgi:transposase
MAGSLVSDELWEAIQPLLPRHKAKPGKRGRPPVNDGACLTGIIFVLQSGIPWGMLPQEMGCGSGVTCWRRLRYWQQPGVWKKLLHALRDRLGREGPIDWSKGVVDSQSIRAVLGGHSRVRTLQSAAKRDETPPAGRWTGHPVGGTDPGSPGARLAGSHAAGRRHRADPAAPRPTPAQAAGSLRGPSLRHTAEPTRAAAQADRGPSGQASDAPRQRLGQDSLGGGARAGLCGARPPAQNPLR